MPTQRKRLDSAAGLFTIAGLAQLLEVQPNTVKTWLRTHNARVLQVGNVTLVPLDAVADMKVKLRCARKLLEEAAK